MLHAADIPLPRQVLAHGFWQKEGAKIAKSLGNIVDPIAVIDEWGLDAFRFYVLRELDIGPDGNWTDASFNARYSAELANGLGNLVNRSLSMLNRYRDGIVPERHDELAPEAGQVLESVRSQLAANQLQAALQSIWSLITRANQYVDQTAPFKLAKNPAQAKRLDEVLYNLAETCRVLSVLLWPFLPTSAGRIHQQLALSGEPGLVVSAAWGGLTPGHKTGKPEPLFPRKDVAK
jgi:methionyl-tRNA synthetase